MALASLNAKSGSQKGQAVVEYVLLLVVAVTVVTLIISGLVNRDEANKGILIRAWQQMTCHIGADATDEVKPPDKSACPQ